MMDFDHYLSEHVRAVDAYLDDYLPSEKAYPESIHRAMRYSLFAGGKRLRPVLTLAAAEAVGGRHEEVMPAAAALELIHTYSLIHDDLPAMDDDSLRRGKPTSHVVFGEAIAILTGDALLTEAFSLLSGITNGDAERWLRAVAILSEAAGVRGMVGGQVVDVESEGLPVGEDVLEYIHRNKTGALIKAAAHIGALLGGGCEEDLHRIDRYGEDLGLAFQIVDDILDIEGDAALLGKTAGKDQKTGKATYPKIHGIEKARRRARELSERAVDIIQPLGQAAEPLVGLARRVLSRRS
jgi:geranylgeranyl diphosphate synthase type II